MSIRSEALRWFSLKHGNTKNKIYASKYFLPENSWNRQHTWWLEVPLKVIESTTTSYINLLCQVSPTKNGFYFLKVPTKYFKEHAKKFHIRKEKVSLYLSAENNKMFIEERGNGKLNFAKFLVS